jgi:TolB protein
MAFQNVSLAESTVESTPTPVPGATPLGGGAGKIAFASNQDGDSHLYIMNVDGSDPHRLTRSKTGEYDPAWSPDGKYLALLASHDGYYTIDVTDAAGKGKYGLTHESSGDPAWSPDGKLIAFAMESMSQGNAIFVVNVDGSGLRRLTEWGNQTQHPAWSPDGKQIAFESQDDGNPEIYVMDADGRNRRRLTSDNAYDGYPAWSPDGKAIAFSSTRGRYWGIYVMNPEGSGLRRLTDSQNQYNDSFPAWSPDGLHLVFVSDRDQHQEIYMMDADSANQRRLTNSGGKGSYSPTWQPRVR